MYNSMIRSRGGTILWQASRARRSGLDMWNRTFKSASCLQNEAAASSTTATTQIPPSTTISPPPPTDVNQVKKEFSNIFLDAFEASNNEIGSHVADSISGGASKKYDVSEGRIYDPVLNGEAPTADDMKLRIVRYLNEGGDISKLLGTSAFESHDSLRERWFESSGFDQFCPVPYKGFTALEYLSPAEFNTVLQLERWQVMRNELLDERYRLLEDGACEMREYKTGNSSNNNGEGNVKTTVRLPASGEFPGLSYASYQDARSKVQSFLKLENAYVLEMWRLYRLTGVEKLKYYIVQTTPVIQHLMWRFYVKDTTAWSHLRRSYGRMVRATSEDAEEGQKQDLGPIGSPVLFSRARRSGVGSGSATIIGGQAVAVEDVGLDPVAGKQAADV